MRRISSSRLFHISLSHLFIFAFFGFAFGQAAPVTEKTKDTPDQILRSNARVNPSTLAMELSVPIADFQGRGKLSMPLVFNYSSKLWRLDLTGYGATQTVKFTTNFPRYSEKAAAGWTSSFGTAQIEAYPEIFDCNGNPLGEAENAQIPPPTHTDEQPQGFCGEGLYYIDGVKVKLPDGESIVMRKDDSYHLYSSGGITLAGTYLSTDGSKTRLELGSSESVLYMPDGSRYFFHVPTGGSEQIGYRFQDSSGNQADYSVSTQTWTDTLGRSLTSPIPLNLAGPQQSVGTQQFYLPGLSGQSARTYELVWKELDDTGVLLDPNDVITYAGNRSCPYGSVTSGNLFLGSPSTRVCQESVPFNPVVMSAINLPNGSSYTFQYNTYGEITKITYPTGATERFAYDTVPTLALRCTIFKTSSTAV